MKCLFFIYILLFTACIKSDKTTLQPKDTFKYVQKKNVEENSLDNYGNFNGELNLVYDNDTVTEYWEIYKSVDNQIELNIPSYWQIKNNECCELLFVTDSLWTKRFSMIVQNKAEINMNLDDYIQNLMTLMQEDTSEIMISKVIDYNAENELFIGQFDTKLDTTSYRIYVSLVEDKENIYDLTMKVEMSDDLIFDEIRFFRVIASIIINGEHLIPEM